jgi:hypothetical protein
LIREGLVETVFGTGTAPTVASVSEKVIADAQRSFAAHVDATLLERQVHEIVALLWTESTKVTTFIPVLALRDLRARLNGGHELA